ncbi:restriction endonuclease [Arthrobacter pityocampae]|uniref:restriction endonuclease n=1 Tax=Arthrobacter pityocampae TaxID=547334 RepID=UPI0037369207
MGYGGAENRGRRIGGTGDGGVDGVIDQDALGLDQIYIQAKRYAADSTVGREAIQSFVGALAGRGATRGVFITTSRFSAQALDYARAIPTRIIFASAHRAASSSPGAPAGAVAPPPGLRPRLRRAMPAGPSAPARVPSPAARPAPPSAAPVPQHPVLLPNFSPIRPVESA